MANFEELITAYRQRFKDDPPLMGMDKAELKRLIQEALETGQPIDYRAFGVPDDADVGPSPWSWREGRFFDRTVTEWLQLDYVPDPAEPDRSYIVAYVSRPMDYVFTVELHPENLPDSLDPNPIMARVRKDLDYFLMDLRERDPVKYLRCRATTAGNAYSQLQWFHVVVDGAESTWGTG